MRLNLIAVSLVGLLSVMGCGKGGDQPTSAPAPAPQNPTTPQPKPKPPAPNPTIPGTNCTGIVGGQPLSPTPFVGTLISSMGFTFPGAIPDSISLSLFFIQNTPQWGMPTRDVVGSASISLPSLFQGYPGNNINYNACVSSATNFQNAVPLPPGQFDPQSGMVWNLSLQGTMQIPYVSPYGYPGYGFPGQNPTLGQQPVRVIVEAPVQSNCPHPSREAAISIIAYKAV